MSDKLRPPVIKWLREPLFDEDGVQKLAGLDDRSREIGDPVPMAPPIGLSAGHGDVVHDLIRKLFIQERAAFMAAINSEEFDTEDEANDFDVDGDPYPADPAMPWEGPFDLPATPPPGDPATPASPSPPAAAAAPEATPAALPAAPVEAKPA